MTLITGSDSIGITGWINDLTYAEVHAMTYGLTHGTGMVACYYVGVIGALGLLRNAALGLALVFVVLNGWVRMTKAKSFPVVGQIVNALPSKVRGQIRDELHYYDGAFLIGVVAALAFFEVVVEVGLLL